MRTITPLCLLLFFCQLQSFAVIDCKITINGTSGNPVCTGANGTIAISPTGGAAPYRYKWTNGDTTSSIIHLLPGSYTVTVTDRNACAALRTFALTATSRVMTLSWNAGNGCWPVGPLDFSFEKWYHKMLFILFDVEHCNPNWLCVPVREWYFCVLNLINDQTWRKGFCFLYL